MVRTKQVNAQNNGSQPSSSKSNGTGVEKARSPSPDASDRPLGPLSVTVPAYEREEVKVNNANLTELKNACDDAVKRVRAALLARR
jgi:signal peptidase complex subunit 2